MVKNVRVDDVGVDAGGGLVPGVLAVDTRHGVGLNPLQVLLESGGGKLEVRLSLARVRVR
jgi:hypothetical protein